MGHTIAMCTNLSSGNLSFVYLRAGKPYSFKQTSDGVWHPDSSEGGQPIAVPTQSTLTFSAIKGINGNGSSLSGAALLAIDSNGGLWYTTQDNSDNWQAGGFNQLPNIRDALGNVCLYKNVDAAWVGQRGLFVVTPASDPGGTLGNASLYCQLLFPSAAPQPIPYTSQVESAAMAAISPGGTPTAVAVALGAGLQVVWAGSDGVNWNAKDSNNFPLGGTIAALAVGGNATLQALVLDQNGVPYLAWDASGNGTNFVTYAENSGMLPNQNNIGFSALAAASGNQGNLQVVGIGKTDGLPYLFWQDAASGSWSGCYQLPIDTSAPGLSDLCTGMGSQQYLQVGYLGTDGKVYVNWQDTNGNWGWYGPLP